MLEVGWSEILVIALILIIVVGPKDLPGMLRTFGRMASRVRSMANEFKGQFDEAIREAELDDVRKGLNEVSKLNPTNSLRDAINPIRQLGQDIKSDLQKATTVPAAEHKPFVEPKVEPVIEPATPSATNATPAVSEPAPVATSSVVPTAVAETPVAPAVAEPVAEKQAKPKAPRKKAEAAPSAEVAVKSEAAPKAAPRKRATKAEPASSVVADTKPKTRKAPAAKKTKEAKDA
ncbi:Sec-independent protein translocase protein TatB [Rhizobium alvei]|uniref:Sec-independent protein translocase protein TatB n=1 Tax=Rhizobium alvei TaxID=1132659 RepID=A0ABT8YJM2_9HYPH|nr:Sec-independent protein translocase protein TatB [Rhizobium alvei]MDO6963887.1 Sec-independent protein translocase protein TatB [Rhizobium alvei]